MVALSLAPQISQALQLSPIFSGPIFVLCRFSYYQYRVFEISLAQFSCFYEYHYIYLDPLAHIIVPPSLGLVYSNFAQCFSVYLCIWFYHLLVEDFIIKIYVGTKKPWSRAATIILFRGRQGPVFLRRPHCSPWFEVESHGTWAFVPSSFLSSSLKHWTKVFMGRAKEQGMEGKDKIDKTLKML